MSYGTVLESEFFDKPEVLQLMQTGDGVRAVLMLLELRNWSASAQSDGVIPKYALRRATTHDDPLDGLKLLASVGLAVEAEESWSIDWSDQKSATERAEQNEYWRLQKRHQRGNHSECPSHWQCRKHMSSRDTGKDTTQDSDTKSNRDSQHKTRQGKTKTPTVSEGDLDEVNRQNPSPSAPPGAGSTTEPGYGTDIPKLGEEF